MREGTDEAQAKALEGFKKDDMARDAEQLQAGTGWLPEPLHVSGRDAASDETGNTATAEVSDSAGDDHADAPSPYEDPHLMATW